MKHSTDVVVWRRKSPSGPKRDFPAKPFGELRFLGNPPHPETRSLYPDTASWGKCGELASGILKESATVSRFRRNGDIRGRIAFSFLIILSTLVDAFDVSVCRWVSAHKTVEDVSACTPVACDGSETGKRVGMQRV